MISVCGSMYISDLLSALPVRSAREATGFSVLPTFGKERLQSRTQ